MDFDRAAIDRRLEELPEGLLQHCHRVSKVCGELAQRFGADAKTAELAGLVHDLTRGLPNEEMLRLAKSHGLPIQEIEQRVPLLLHGRVTAEILRREAGITDEELLQAVSYHTTGHANMALLDKIVFLADKIEPGKFDYYPGIRRIGGIARTDLDGAILEFMNQQIVSLAKKGQFIHPQMVAARNSLLLKLSAED